jgi:hypothetical protein
MRPDFYLPMGDTHMSDTHDFPGMVREYHPSLDHILLVFETEDQAWSACDAVWNSLYLDEERHSTAT